MILTVDISFVYVNLNVNQDRILYPALDYFSCLTFNSCILVLE